MPDIPSPIMPLSQNFESLISELRAVQHEFELPISRPEGSYFPDFLASKLDAYRAFCQEALIEKLKATGIRPSGHGADLLNSMLSRLGTLIDGINAAVSLHYEGKLRQANERFDEALASLNFISLTSVGSIQPGSEEFYRAREGGERRLTRKDIFHIPFQSRHLIATNRYSIPGLPALYLGNSTYVCWEEFTEPSIGTLNFSRFANTRPLNVVRIYRLADFLNSITENWMDNERGMDLLVRFVLLFPLSIACTIKTLYPTGKFKAEYIVPQLLLQYVTKHEEIDGIMFPSTKVNYSSIRSVPAYNYVFPARAVAPTGFCPVLSALFHLTEPTSLELERLINHAAQDALGMNEWKQMESKTVTIVEGIDSPYPITAFGNIERVLRQRDMAACPN